MAKRVRIVAPPDSGVVLRWGRADYGDDPDLVAAWGPGAKSAARAVLALLDSKEARAQLDAAGVDRTSIRLTLRLKGTPDAR